MAEQRKKRGMTHGRIVSLVLVLLFAAQGTLISIGLYYANSIYKTIQSQRSGVILDQYEQNVTQQLNDINNLLLLLQMPGIYSYFTEYMCLRDDPMASDARQQLLNKLNSLQLSPDIVDSIYILGENANQQAHRYRVDGGELEDLPTLRLDRLHYSRLEELFLRNNDQFIRYGMQDFLHAYNPGSAILTPEEVAEIDAFLNNLDGRIIITGGIQKTFTVIVLNDRIFNHVLPAEPYGQAVFSIVRSDSMPLWSTTGEPAMLNAIAGGDASAAAQAGSYRNVSKVIRPFNLRIVYSEKESSGLFLKYDLPGGMLIISLCTLTVAFLFSFFYLQFVFRPFRRISGKMDLKQEPNGTAWYFRPLPESLIQNRFHSISLRNKLIILFSVALSILVCANGFLFSQLLTREVDNWIDDSVKEIGEFAAVGVSNEIQFYENLANQISASQQFQNYLSDSSRYPFTPYQPLTKSPGWNNISYLLLLNKAGSSIYSTIYSNNNQIFNLASMYLLDTHKPYWIEYYNGITNEISIAVLRKIGEGNSGKEAWLLIVPKGAALRITETERIKAKYTISNPADFEIYEHNSIPNSPAAGGLHFEKQLRGTDWKLTIDYVFSDLAAMMQAYQERLIFSIVIVFLLSAGMVIRISTVLTKPIMRLKDIMQAAELDGVARFLDYDRVDEIGGIIHSYNRMIVKLEDTTRENLRIMEENAHNKIRENELLSLKTRAEMNMLQAQINPHFLHNTLAAINMQSLKRGDSSTSRMVNALADLLRYSISVSTGTAPLEQEIKHATNYVTIQQIRFGNSFEAVFDVPDAVCSVTVLRFILQPIIENSIMHGFEGWESGGKITVTVRAEGETLVITVGDNGVGMDGGTLERLRSELKGDLADWKTDGCSIGLKNVYYRLKLNYQERMKMEIQSELMKGTEVRMEFPANTERQTP